MSEVIAKHNHLLRWVRLSKQNLAMNQETGLYHATKSIFQRSQLTGSGVSVVSRTLLEQQGGAVSDLAVAPEGEPLRVVIYVLTSLVRSLGFWMKHDPIDNGTPHGYAHCLIQMPPKESYAGRGFALARYDLIKATRLVYDDYLESLVTHELERDT